jgi:hypothetical protein
MVFVIGALLVAPEPVTAHLTKLRAPEMAGFLDMSWLDMLQREGFFERVTNHLVIELQRFLAAPDCVKTQRLADLSSRTA